MSNTGIAYGSSDWSGKIGPCIAKEFVINGVALMKNILVEEQSTACFTLTITQTDEIISSELCLVTTRVEGTC